MAILEHICALLLTASTLTTAACGGVGFSNEQSIQKGKEMGTKKAVTYSVVGYDNNDGSYIISGYNVKDYGAKGDGQADDTQAIVSALAAAKAAGGAVVYLPAGQYRVTTPGIRIGNSVTLIGQWNDPKGTAKGEETVILADYTADHDAPLFLLSTESSLLDLCIYYPRQTIDSPLAYNYAVSTQLSGGFANKVTVKNITLVNAYRGIEGAGSGQHLSHIGGTILSEGIHIGPNAEVSEILYVDFNAGYWNAYDQTDTASINAYGQAHAVGIRMGRCDDYLMYDIHCPPASFARGIHFAVEVPSAGSEYQTGIAYGGCYQLYNTVVSMDENYAEATPKGWPINRFLDDVPQTDTYSFSEPAERFSTKADLFNVCDYGAKGDGRDDTEAFRKALTAAGENGGGIVFVPSGQYCIYASLTVPANVEVRGEWYGYRLGSPSVIKMKKADRFTDSLFILSEDSGVQGLCIRQPDVDQSLYGLQDYKAVSDTFPEEQAGAIAKTPYIFRGNGKNCYIETVSIVNCNYGIDLASAKCDQFVVRGIWATCMDAGIRVGGGSENGRLSCLFFSYGPWWEDERCTNDIQAYTRSKTQAFRFEDCRNIVCFSIGCFAVRNAIIFAGTETGAPENISILRAVCDMAYGESAIRFERGNDISILFASTGITGEQRSLGRTGAGLNVTDTFDGTAYIYGQNIWSGGVNLLSRTVKVFTEESDPSNVETIDHDFDEPDYSPVNEPTSTPTETPTTTPTPTLAPANESNTGKWIAGIAAICALLGGAIALLFRKRKH